MSCTPPVGIVAGCAAYSRQIAAATVGLSAWRAVRGLRAMLRASLVRASAQTSHSLCCTFLPAQDTAIIRLDPRYRQGYARMGRPIKSLQAHDVMCTHALESRQAEPMLCNLTAIITGQGELCRCIDIGNSSNAPCVTVSTNLMTLLTFWGLLSPMRFLSGFLRHCSSSNGSRCVWDLNCGQPSRTSICM